ncbi:Potassium/sodium hyperpolarization-activated cyclic nucleotide-gated channel 4 [Chytriomyces hyalinus]|nr:Potassium/sodium hyperpolarization-activated cyclic nucleotide-gated channel 4 [Chytriomyces hyalinus]
MPMDTLFATLMPELQSTLSTCKIAVLKCEAMMALLNKAKNGDARVMSGSLLEPGGEVSNQPLPRNPSLQSKSVPSRNVSGSFLDMGIRWDPEDYAAMEEITSTSANPAFATSSKQCLPRKLKSSLQSSNQSFVTVRKNTTHFRRDSATKTPPAAFGGTFDGTVPRSQRGSVVAGSRRDPAVSETNAAMLNPPPTPLESLPRNAAAPYQKSVTSNMNLMSIASGQQHMDFFYQMRTNGCSKAKLSSRNSSAESVEVNISQSVASINELEKVTDKFADIGSPKPSPLLESKQNLASMQPPVHVQKPAAPNLSNSSFHSPKNSSGRQFELDVLDEAEEKLTHVSTQPRKLSNPSIFNFQHPKVKAAYRRRSSSMRRSSGDTFSDSKKLQFAKTPPRSKSFSAAAGFYNGSNETFDNELVDWHVALCLLPAFDNKGRRVGLDSFELEDLMSIQFITNGLHPKSVFNTYWDLTMIVLFSVIFWMIPFVISFQPLLPDRTLQFTCYSVTVIFFLESLVSAVTPIASISTSVIYSFREYEVLRPDLASWLNNWILWKSPLEFLTLIPLEIMFPELRFSSVFLLIKLLRSWKYPSMISRCALLKRLQAHLDSAAGMSVSKILPIAVAMMYFIHWNACTMYFLGRVNGFTGWGEYWRGFSTATLFQFYTWTTYQSLGNMFPLGFFPETAGEQLTYSVFIIVAAVLYASFLGAISSAAMSINPAGRLYTQKMEELLDYVKFKNLPEETTEKLFDYYETKYRGKYFEEEEMLAEMNESLRAEILLNNTRALIEQVPFLRREENDGRDEIFIGRLARALRSHYFVQGDFITKQGDTGYDMFFILSGKLDVIIQGERVVSLYDGSYIGEVALISKGLRTASVLAAKPSVLYRLSHSDFHEVLEEFPDMKFRIDQLALERERMLVSRY